MILQFYVVSKREMLSAAVEFNDFEDCPRSGEVSGLVETDAHRFATAHIGLIRSKITDVAARSRNHLNCPASVAGNISRR